MADAEAGNINIEYFKKPVSLLRYTAIIIILICLCVGGDSGFGYSDIGRSYLAFGSLLLIFEVIHLIIFGLNLHKLNPCTKIGKPELVGTIIEIIFLIAFIIIECKFTSDLAPVLKIAQSAKIISAFFFGYLYTLIKIVLSILVMTGR